MEIGNSIRLGVENRIRNSNSDGNQIRNQNINNSENQNQNITR